jgi:hypothetical protein
VIVQSDSTIVGDYGETLQTLLAFHIKIEAMVTIVDMPPDPSPDPTDPDAQATVTDFLDYTEHLPADIIRSLSLLRGLDDTFFKNAHAVHEDTRQYGTLGKLPPPSRQDAQALRATVSGHLDLALNAREASFAEAVRLFDVADRHCHRLSSIVNKLHALPKPPSPHADSPSSTSPETKQARGVEDLDDGTVDFESSSGTSRCETGSAEVAC